MKYLLTLVTFLTLSSAHASYFATKCSNSDASVRWETGHNSNTLIMGENTIPFYDLVAKYEDEVVIREERIHRCGFASSTKVYTAKVTFTPSEHKPDVLDFLGETKKIEVEVICTNHMNSRAGCPE